MVRLADGTYAFVVPKPRSKRDDNATSEQNKTYKYVHRLHTWNWRVLSV